MSLRTVLQELQELFQINDAELARVTGIPQATIYRLVSGMTDDPKISSIKPLANFFNITIGQLTGDEPLPTQWNNHMGNNKWNYKLPIISWEQACNWKEVIANLNYGNWSEWCSTNFPISPNAYAIVVTNKTFGLPFPAHTVVLIEPNLVPNDGDYVAIQLDDSNTISLRKWVVDGDQRWLSPLQPHLAATKCEEHKGFCGVVIQAYLSLREHIS